MGGLSCLLGVSFLCSCLNNTLWGGCKSEGYWGARLVWCIVMFIRLFKRSLRRIMMGVKKKREDSQHPLNNRSRVHPH